MARPSSAVSASTELAISAHMRWRLGLSAFLVWRSASSAVHGISSPPNGLQHFRANPDTAPHDHSSANFAVAGEKVAPGLVTNLNRPGGNITGVSFYTSPVG